MSTPESRRKPTPLRRREDYQVAIVAALPKEKDAIDAILDHSVPSKDALQASESDYNHCTFGVLGNHHVVVTQLPGMGTTNAASTAASMRMSFPNIKLCLLVGICGIVPLTEKDDEGAVERFLGDVVIAESIIQYDFGKGNESDFVRKSMVTDVPGRPSTKVQNILGHLQTWKGKNEFEADVRANLEALLKMHNIPPSSYPSLQKCPDLAFPSDYIHRHDKNACCDVQPPCYNARKESCVRLGCEQAKALQRERCPVPNEPQVFVGLVGVANLVQKSAKSRDSIANEVGVIAFEMESVGIWDNFPDVVVIKSGCDYADSHKNDSFHRYASATSAACAKAFLSRYRLDGNVRYDDPDDSSIRVGAYGDSRDNSSSQAPQGSNIYSGTFRNSAFGPNSIVNNQ